MAVHHIFFYFKEAKINICLLLTGRLFWQSLSGIVSIRQLLNLLFHSMHVECGNIWTNFFSFLYINSSFLFFSYHVFPPVLFYFPSFFFLMRILLVKVSRTQRKCDEKRFYFGIIINLSLSQKGNYFYIFLFYFTTHNADVH